MNPNNHSEDISPSSQLVDNSSDAQLITIPSQPGQYIYPTIKNRTIDIAFLIIAIFVAISPLSAFLGGPLDSSPYAITSEFLSYVLTFFILYKYILLSNFVDKDLVSRFGLYIYRFFGQILGFIFCCVFCFVVATHIPSQKDTFALFDFIFFSSMGWLYIFGIDLADRVYIHDYKLKITKRQNKITSS